MEEKVKELMKTYPNAGHAFNNDTGPRYDPEAAADAWGIMLRFFGMVHK